MSESRVAPSDRVLVSMGALSPVAVTARENTAAWHRNEGLARHRYRESPAQLWVELKKLIDAAEWPEAGCPPLIVAFESSSEASTAVQILHAVSPAERAFELEWKLLRHVDPPAAAALDAWARKQVRRAPKGAAP